MFMNYCLLFLFFNVFINYCSSQKSLKQLESNQKCTRDLDCSDKNSFCLGNTVNTTGLCTCLNDSFIPLKNDTYYKCLPIPENISDPCEHDLQCQVAFSHRYSNCGSEGHCECIQNSHYHQDKCYQSVKLNSYCQTNSNCLLKDGTFAGCIDGICACGQLRHPYSDASGESCELNLQMGENCTTNGQCSLTEHAKCLGVCKCSQGYTENYDQTKCLKIASMIGDDCTDEIQCEHLPNTECAARRCKCIKAFHDVKNVCYEDAELDEQCSNINQCILNPSLQDVVTCANSICACTGVYEKEGNYCVSFGNVCEVHNSIILFTVLISFLLSTVTK